MNKKRLLEKVLEQPDGRDLAQMMGLLPISDKPDKVRQSVPLEESTNNGQ